MTKEQAIRILSSDTSAEEINKLKYYAGFNQDKVLEQIQEALDMGADALRKLGEYKKLSKKILDKNFTNVELTLLENLNKEYKWIARDKRNTLYVYKEDEPFTTGTVWSNCSVNYARFPYDDIFKSISYEDKKATYIDDYVDRK